MDSYDVLVVILSITLAILLVVSILLVVALIKLVNQVKLIVAKAEEIVDDVEAVSGFFRRNTPAMAITSLISNIVSKVTSNSGKKDTKE